MAKPTTSDRKTANRQTTKRDAEAWRRKHAERRHAPGYVDRSVQSNQTTQRKQP
jgi:hypothetical protein